MSRPGRRAAALLALAPALAALVLLPPAQAQGGGAVSNVAPAVESFTAQAATAHRESQLAGEVSDHNGEADLVELRLHRPSPGAPAWSNHTLTAADRNATAPPAAADQGWRVWDPAAGDGLLSWSYNWTPAASGVHPWNLTALDEASGASRVLNVSVAAQPGVDYTVEDEPDDEPPEDPAAPVDGQDGGTDGGPLDPASLPDPGIPHDLSLDLVVTWADGEVRLEWPAVPGALGYQVWRHASPWELRAELAGDEAHYEEPLPDGDAFYKVTFFTSRTAEGGWAPDGEHVSSIPGWNEDSAVPVGGFGPEDDEPEADGSPWRVSGESRRALVGLLAAVAVAVALLLWTFARKP